MEPIRVLVVDDEHELASTLAERLGIRGFHAEFVTDGQAALALLERSAFDVLVLDVKMPGIGGLDLIRRVKQTHPSLEVIFVTGHGSEACAEEGMDAGAFRYLMKPVSLGELVRLIHEATGRRRPKGAP